MARIHEVDADVWTADSEDIKKIKLTIAIDLNSVEFILPYHDDAGIDRHKCRLQTRSGKLVTVYETYAWMVQLWKGQSQHGSGTHEA